MSQCSQTPKGDGGTGKRPVSYRVEIKSNVEGKKGLISRQPESGPFAVPPSLSDCQADLNRFLAANPAQSARDWKGKGFHEFAPFDRYHVEPSEQPWQKLDRAEVRRLATSSKARFLSRSQRMAAARDPGLVWDERSRSYRLKAEATPAPSLAIEGDAYREGVKN